MITLLHRLADFLQHLIEKFDDILDVFPDEDEPIPYLPVEVA